MDMVINNIFSSLKELSVEVGKILQNRDASFKNSSNISGDNQLNIDVKIDNIFCDLARSLPIAGFVSEEQDNICFNKKIDFDLKKLTASKDELFLAFDPLDGSSLVDSNLTIGSIFGIYQGGLQGSNLIASIYFLYGPRLECVSAYKNESLHYIYNHKNSNWDFLQQFKLKEKGNINSPGSTQKNWTKAHFDYVQSFFNEGYRLRYSGGMVADLHQILCKGGGIFSYPATICRSVKCSELDLANLGVSDSQTAKLDSGKLRKLFEVFPFALIFEYANGYALDGRNRLLASPVNSIHESIPCFFGSKYEIDRLKNYE